MWKCWRGCIFLFSFFFQNKLFGHCVVWFLVKLPALYKLLTFESRHFYSTYSEIPVGREVLNCQHRRDNVLASREDVLHRYAAFMKWRLAEEIKFSDNYTMPPPSRPQILNGIQRKGCSGLTVNFRYYLHRSRHGHICAKNTCAVNFVWCLLLHLQTISNYSISFRTGSVFHKANWTQSAVIKRTYRDVNTNYIAWLWSFRHA